VSDVLAAAGLDSEQLLGNWDIEELDKLPNIRLHRPRPHRRHTPWRIITDNRLNILPSLEAVLVDVAYRARRGGAMPAGTTVWEDNKQLESFTSAELVTWTKRVLEGEQLLARVLNMSMSSLIGAEKSQEYRQRAAEVAAEFLSQDMFHQNQPNANITPRGTRTEVHHDSAHHISTVFGSATRRHSPAKLWLLWPSTELRHLASCYSNTNAALQQMDHGSFLVQLSGESVFVPPNSPHAVIALDSSYLHGHTFTTESYAHEPSTVLVNIKAGY